MHKVPIAIACARRSTQPLGAMKSYFLEGIRSIDAAKAALSARLPGQQEPWLLRSPGGDPIAYFNVQSHLDGQPVLNIQADVSVRHHNDDAAVVAVLVEVRAVIGGQVSNDA
jgi:hypothetical protein